MTHDDDAFLNSNFTPRSFFLPGIDDPDAAESIYNSTAKNLHGDAVSPRRIQRLDYIHEGRRFRAEVGQQDQRGEGQIMAIFDATAARRVFYVTTLNRAVRRGEPIMVGQSGVQEIFEFLPE